jgi:hypothetical protein
MQFGRMSNMRRRTYRPDENFHRGRRRKNVDRSAMLYASGRRKPLVVRMVSAVLSLFSRK